MSKFPCEFCGVVFTRKYNLNRHIGERCASKDDPVKLLEIIEQKDKIIEDLKTNLSSQQNNTNTNNNTKAGKQQNANTINDHSTNTTNITNNITNIYNTNVKLYAFRRADMVFALDRYKKDNKIDFISFSHEIYDYIRKNDLKSIIRLTFRHLHDNSHFKQGHNIVYCNSGEHKGKFLTFNNSDEFIGWYVTNIKVIVKVICEEISKIIELKMSMDDTNDARKHSENFTIADHQIIGKFEHGRHDLLKHPKFQQYAIAIIKEHVTRKKPKPIHSDPIDLNIPFDNKLSRNAYNDNKTKKKLKFNDASESSESSSGELSSLHSDDSAWTKMKKRGVSDSKGSKESESGSESSSELSSESSSELSSASDEKQTAEQIKRDRIHEEARQKRKAEEARDEQLELEYKHKCKVNGTEYVSKAQRLIAEQYENLQSVNPKKETNAKQIRKTQK